jgi:catechol 2,3-dioxygenase-like lactoylglutathione lyase family enzyme
MIFLPSPFLRIDTLFIPVKDLGKSVEWYTQTLEFGLNWRNDEGGYACIDVGAVPITLAQIPEDKGFTPFTKAPCNFFVQDVEKAYRSLKDKGVEVGEIDKFYQVQWFWFKDPDGNRLEVCSYEG